MNTTGIRLIIDTNIIIAIIGKKSPFRWIFDNIINGDFILCVSSDIIYEYREIMLQKNGKVVSDNFYNFLTIHPYVENYHIYYNFNLITQDPSDNKFVDCAIASNAICVVSNDSHFKVLNEIDFPKVTVLTLHEFEQQFKAINK
ncbi:MAG: putative toxin-antitoxin system toxin component, PIN family [Bacteroidota bacterium]